jgi:hypothetical protein
MVVIGNLPPLIVSNTWRSFAHGTITRSDPNGNAVHVVTLSNPNAFATPPNYTPPVINDFTNPPNAETLREITTKYDSRNRPIARTVWLVARGTVDVNNTPIAGDAGVPAAEGLATRCRSMASAASAGKSGCGSVKP